MWGMEVELGTSVYPSHVRIRGPGRGFVPFALDVEKFVGRGAHLERLALVILWDGYFLIVKIPGRSGPDV